MALRRVATSVGAAAVVLSVAAAPVLAADLQLGAEVFMNNCGAPGLGSRGEGELWRALGRVICELRMSWDGRRSSGQASS